MKNSLQQYLAELLVGCWIDHTFRALRDEEGRIEIHVSPVGFDGYIRTFRVDGNVLTPLHVNDDVPADPLAAGAPRPATQLVAADAC